MPHAGVLQGILQFHQHSPPWAHRDIKPANVLLGPGDLPVLMDFGSTAIARKKINTRQEALLLQEDAAQNCSMPYRAPELFDVPSNATIDERTDVLPDLRHARPDRYPDVDAHDVGPDVPRPRRNLPFRTTRRHGVSTS